MLRNNRTAIQVTSNAGISSAYEIVTVHLEKAEKALYEEKKE
jgi:hypothetical protein